MVVSRKVLASIMSMRVLPKLYVTPAQCLAAGSAMKIAWAKGHRLMYSITNWSITFAVDAPKPPTYPHVIGPAWSWDGDFYRPAAQLIPGVAYWLYCGQQTAWQFAP